MRLLCIMLMMLILPYKADGAILWAPQAAVSSIYPDGSGYAFIVNVGSIGGTCSGSVTTRFFLPMTDPNYEAKVATLMTAFSLGAPVAVAYDDTTLGSCAVRADRIQVYRS